MSITANYPSTRPVLSLDFAKSRALDPRITFTRASTATRTNRIGLIESVPSNAPRINYDPVTLACKGLLIEEARTNLHLYSQDFSTGWTTTANAATTLAAAAATAPDGTTTAGSFLCVDTTDVVRRVYPSANITVSVSTAYTASIYVKPVNDWQWVSFSVTGGTSVLGGMGGVSFDLTNGIVGTTIQTSSDATLTAYSITAVGNGWFRLVISGVQETTSTNLRPKVILLDADESMAAAAVGVVGAGVYVWGAQLEAGACPTSYIPSANTFTSRASSASYYNSLGVLTTAGTNVARMNYNPANLTVAPKLLLEEARTNLLTYSENFDNAAWAKTRSSVSADATTAPDGTTTADKFVEDTTASNNHLIRASDTSFTSGAIYTSSVYMKAAERTWGALRFPIGAFGATLQAYFNLSTGAVGTITASTTAAITPVGNGWYRCSITATATATTADSGSILLADADNSLSYTGDGVSGLYLWGAQLEAGAYPTSYIATTTAEVTRAADLSTSAQTTRAVDVAVMTGTNFSSWFNATEGTFVAEGSVPSVVLANRYFLQTNPGTTAAQNLNIGISRSADSRRTMGISVGTSQFSYNPAGTVTSAKGALAYKENDSQGAWDGTAGPTDTVCTLPATAQTTLNIGDNYAGTYTLNGHIQRITYYPQRLAEAQLVALTAP